jgi:hypothetical protein
MTRKNWSIIYFWMNYFEEKCPRLNTDFIIFCLLSVDKWLDIFGECVIMQKPSTPER